MRAELAERLRRIMRGEAVPEYGVTGVAGVTDTPRLRRKPQQLRRLRQLRLEKGSWEKRAEQDVSEPVTAPTEADFDAIEERAAMAADRVPACYLDAWARLQCQRPLSTSEAEWRLAIHDAGMFLDGWGLEAAAMEWAAGDLLDVPIEGRLGGLVWQLSGDRVEILGADHARLADGRTIERSAK
jgi:hypothetical protein